MARLRLVLLLALVALTAGAVAACGSSSGDDASTSTSPGTTATGGTCSLDEITAAITAAGKAQGTTAELTKGGNGFKCADGWATADVSMGDANEAVDVTLVFRRDGDTWVAADREKACKAPGDQVPKSLFELACGSN